MVARGWSIPAGEEVEGEDRGRPLYRRTRHPAWIANRRTAQATIAAASLSLE
jgi:hypothetical protein